MAIVLHHSRAKGTDKVVLLGIANHAGDGGAWPSLATLAKYGNVTEKAARASLRRLESMGEVITHLNGGGLSSTPSWKRPNRYDITLACPVTCDRTSNHRLRPLPQAPADLWIEGGPSTGGGHSDGGYPLPSTGGHPLPSTGGEPSIEPPNNDPAHSPASTTGRARLRSVCVICSQPEAECQRRAAVSGHTFTPRAS